MNHYMGIDPGKEGAMAVIDDDRNIIETKVMTTIRDFYEFMKRWASKNPHIFLEKAQVFPKNGSVGMFNYGKHFGELIGVLTSLSLSHYLIPPMVWTKTIHDGIAGIESKPKSRIAIARLFPDAELFNPNIPAKKKGKRADHMGIIDALLIADFGRLKVCGALEWINTYLSIVKT